MRTVDTHHDSYSTLQCYDFKFKVLQIYSPGAPFELFMSLKSRDFTPRPLTLIQVNIGKYQPSIAIEFFAMSIYSYALKIYFLIKAHINVIEQMLVNSFMLFG